MAVTSFDGQFSFKQDSLARLGQREPTRMNAAQQAAFQNSPFMQGVRKCEDLCWKFTCSRDEARAKRDPSFQPSDEDFNAPKAHAYEKAIDYYKVLGLDDYASLDEVKKAYKKLSLVYHPDKTAGLSAEQKEEYSGIFMELKNAYLTLGDQATRRQYDRDRDRDQAQYELNGWKPKKRAHFDASEMLKKLQEMQKPPGQLVDVPMSAKLEKFVYGGHKKIQRQRRVKDFVGFSTETRLYRVDIPRGAAEPHECLFRRQGDHNEHTSPDSLNFKISAKPHAVVERQGCDLVCKAVVHLGEGSLRSPYVSAQAPSVNGRHILLWGRNPFVDCQGVTGGNLRVRLRGEGVSEAGVLKVACRLGAVPAGAARPAEQAEAAAWRGAGVETGVFPVQHMQTEAKVWLRLPTRATVADVRAKITQVLNLPRGSSVKILQAVRGGFSSFADSHPIRGESLLRCAGTPWADVSLTPNALLDMLRQVVSEMETEAFQVDVARSRAGFQTSEQAGQAAQRVVLQRLAEHLPDFGHEPTPEALLRNFAAAFSTFHGKPGEVATLFERVGSLEMLTRGSVAPDGLPGGGGARTPGRRSAKRFLQRHGLGPPEGFDGPGSETEGEDQSGGGGGAGAAPTGGGLSRAPAMRRRVARQRLKERTCELELVQVGEPITLFTRPTCTVTYYSNAGQALAAAPGLVKPRLMFGLSISAPSCAKRAAASEWASLKARLVPCLEATAFLLLRAALAVLPRPLASAPAAERRDEGKAAAEKEFLATHEGVIDYERCCARQDGESGERLRQRCEQARRERTAFLKRQAELEWQLAASVGTPMPWKQVGDNAFRRGEYFTGAACYTRCLDALEQEGLGTPDNEPASSSGAEGPIADELGQRVAVVLSNRSACFAKAGLFEESLTDAEAALGLRPHWGRAWGRVGAAALALGRAREGVDAYLKAVAAEPTAAHVAALLQAAAGLGADADAAHAEKEAGNVATRAGDFGLAVAHLTRGVARLPPKAQGDAADAADAHALLRCVLFSNRSAAFARLKNWPAALQDAESAVAAKEDFPKAHCRRGMALLGSGLNEDAYVAFARALALEPNDPVALKGRQACISLLPLWSSQRAARWQRRRFGADLARPSGSTKVYAVSDVHFDHKCNEDWAHRIDDFKFREDVLVVAGNMCDTANGLRRALTTLRSKFRRVFYVPGNHEHWVHPSESAKFPDSFTKLMRVLEICDELDVDVHPAAVCRDVFIVPLLSWYTAEFDEDDPFPDPLGKVDQHCRWPIPDTQVWKYMMKLNSAHVSHLYHGTVISCSHFLPRRTLPFSDHFKAAKSMGCARLDEQVRELKGSRRAHVYGHSHRRHVETTDGVMYVNHYHGEDGGKTERAPLLLIYDGRGLISRTEDICDGAPVQRV